MHCAIGSALASLCHLTGLALALALLVIPASAQSIRTGKEVYAPREPVDLSFEGAPGSGRSFVALAPLGASESHNRNGQRLGEQTSGSLALKGLARDGAYEVRLYAADGRTIIARHPFTIGDTAAAGATAGEEPPAQRPRARQEQVTGTPPEPAEPQPVDGPQIRTAKQVYQAGETITVTFSAAPALHRDWVAIAPLGAADTTNYNGVFLNGQTEGTADIRPLQTGVYEARLYDGQAGAVAARHVFSIGETCLDAGIAETTVCPPSVRTEKDEYAAGEPITVFFEGAAGANLDWVGIVEKTADGTYRAPPGGSARFGPYSAPDGEWKPAFALKRALKGSETLAGLDPGTYEARLHFQGAPPEAPAARHEFTVGDFESSVRLGVLAEKDGAELPADLERFAADLPEPGIEGNWLGQLSCTQRGSVRGAATDITNVFLDIAPGAASADMYVVWRGRDGAAIRLTGSHDPTSGRLALSPAEWIYPARRGGTPLSLELALDPSGLRMSGTVTGEEGCAEFQAVKYRRDDRPDYDQGMLAALARYGDTLLTEEHCIALLGWMENKGVVETMGIDVPAQVMDADGFYRVVGKSYDRWTLDDRQLFQGFWDRCIGAFRGNANIAVSSLIERALSDRPLWTFIGASIPPESRPNPREHFRYLGQYASVVALRNGRLYADLQAAQAQALPDSRENLLLLADEIESVVSGDGVFVALPENERQQSAAALTARKEEMSGVLVDEAFAAFDMDGYPLELGGLQRAWEDRRTIESAAASYATPAQLSDLKSRFDRTFTAHSAAVRDQALDAMPAIAATLDGIAEGKRGKDRIEQAVAPHLLPPDRDALLSAYEQRNVAAIEALLPDLPDALAEEIPPDETGRSKLEEISRLTLGAALADLPEQRFPTPYSRLAGAIAERAESLKYQVCDLPPGFAELLPTICPEAVAVAQAQDGG